MSPERPRASSASSRSKTRTLCSRYTARVIRDVKIGPSPEWLAQKVTAAGARSINNIVDVTNYVMFELGQPLHAFDMDTLGTDEHGRAAITVRTARPAERLTTLDGVERTWPRRR